MLGGGSQSNTGTFQPDFSGGAFGFPSNEGMNGFRPAGTSESAGAGMNWGFKPASGSPGM